MKHDVPSLDMKAIHCPITDSPNVILLPGCQLVVKRTHKENHRSDITDGESIRLFLCLSSVVKTPTRSWLYVFVNCYVWNTATEFSMFCDNERFDNIDNFAAKLSHRQKITWSVAPQYVKPKSTAIFNEIAEKEHRTKKNLMQLWFRFSCLQRKLFNQLFEFFCEYGVFQFLCSFKRRKRRYQKNLRKCNWNGCGWTSTWSRTMRDSQTTENFCSSAVNKTVFSFKRACQL